MSVSQEIRVAWACYALSIVVIAIGACLAVWHYPTSFEWGYTVMSALASQKHNPAGFAWFAGALGGSMVLLWPATRCLERSVGARGTGAHWAVWALRVGLIFGVMVAIESLVFADFSRIIHKGHEILALVAFLGAYAGVLGLHAHHLRQRSVSIWILASVSVPLVAVGLSEAVLYLGQRDVGWLDHNWRETGIPLWLSFAFWQWLAAAALWLGIGHLLFVTHRRYNESPLRSREHAPSPGVETSGRQNDIVR